MENPVLSKSNAVGVSNPRIFYTRNCLNAMSCFLGILSLEDDCLLECSESADMF